VIEDALELSHIWTAIEVFGDILLFETHPG